MDAYLTPDDRAFLLEVYETLELASRQSQRARTVRTKLKDWIKDHTDYGERVRELLEPVKDEAPPIDSAHWVYAALCYWANRNGSVYCSKHGDFIDVHQNGTGELVCRVHVMRED